MAVLNNGTILKALSATGERLGAGCDIEILLVGGAAGVLINTLPAAWTTADVDAIHFHLPQDRDEVLDAAADAGRELLLPADWLNDWGGLFGWTLPVGWEGRRVHVGTFGRLRVYAVCRLDLMAMKFIAHRPGDLEHLERMNVRHEDLEFVRRYLDSKARGYPEEASKIEMARQYVDGWDVM